MNFFVSIKVVKAEPMSKYVAHKVLGRDLNEECIKDPQGYLVEYEDGYKSWCPKEAFEKGYVPFNKPFTAIYKLIKLLF